MVSLHWSRRLRHSFKAFGYFRYTLGLEDEDTIMLTAPPRDLHYQSSMARPCWSNALVYIHITWFVVPPPPHPRPFSNRFLLILMAWTQYLQWKAVLGTSRTTCKIWTVCADWTKRNNDRRRERSKADVFMQTHVPAGIGTPSSVSSEADHLGHKPSKGVRIRIPSYITA